MSSSEWDPQAMNPQALQPEWIYKSYVIGTSILHLPPCTALRKLHAVLEVEEAKCMEAKAALEEAHREMERLRRDYQVWI